jgi:hypothetical protein
MPSQVTFKSFKVPALWSAADSQVTALDTVALIKRRIYKGIDSTGRPFLSYSTRPIYVPKKGARLTPKGGREARGGRSVYYAGGYAEYKEKSRRRVAGGANQTAEVDLTLSGALVNNIQPLQVSKSGYTIGLTSAVRGYGYRVNERRPYLGLSPNDVKILSAAVAARIRKKLPK